MVIIQSITLTKAKETIIMCTDATCLSTQHWLVCCTNKLKCVKTLFWDCFNQILLKMCFYRIPHYHSFTFIWLKMPSETQNKTKSPLGRQEAGCGHLVEVDMGSRVLLQCIADNFSGTLAAGTIKVGCLIGGCLIGGCLIGGCLIEVWL